jgi:transcriptional regulator GlxA family with amidase domain
VAEVVQAVGFASVKHFSNVYAERFGRRPSEYRTAGK